MTTTLPAPAAAPSAAPPPRRHRRAVAWVAAGAVAVLLLAEIATRLVADRLPTPMEWSHEEIQVKVDDLRAIQRGGQDVSTVFVGSSMMDAAAEAGRFAAAAGEQGVAYNAAILGADVRTIRDWLQEFVTPTVAPGRVVIGFSCRELNANEPEQDDQYRRFAASLGYRRLVGDLTALERFDDAVASRSALVAHRRELRQPRNLLGRDRRALTGYEIAADGQDRFFAGRRYPTPQDLPKVLFRGAMAQWSLDGERLRLLGSTVETARGAGAEVVVVAMPTTQDFVDWFPRGAADSARCHAALAETTRAAGGTYLEAGVWPKALFADPIHLNGLGSARFTSFVAQGVRGG